MKKSSNYYLIAFLVIALLLCTLLLDSSLGSRIVTIITVGTALLGAVSVLVQYKRDKNISQATFILEYAKYFYELSNVEETMFLLDEYRNGNKDAVKKINYNGIVNYLVWCEELSSLIQRGILDFETIDNLFSYNFFLITNNKYIQEKELVPQAEFYKGVYYLHYAWTKYKKNTKQAIINEEESLDKVTNYLTNVKKGNFYNKNIY
ncbi:MAG: hypothetical protein J5892_01150 [Bacilli bacterium]|nr:hypothetical protein [Bacilli bacterium]